MRESKKAALRITGTYALISLAWILFSDQAVASMFPGRLEQLVQSAKGFAFVLVTAGLIYTLVLRLGDRLSVEAVRSRAAERQLRQVVATVPVGVVLTGADGKVSFVNRGAERLLGVKTADVVGGEIDALMGDNDAAGSPISDLMRMGAIDGIRVGGRGGAPVRSVVARAAAIDPELESTGWVIALADVTAAHAARAEAERLVSTYRFMVEVIDAASRASDEKTLLRRFAEVAVSSGRYRGAWAAIVDPDTGAFHDVASPGMGPRALETASTMLEWSRTDPSKVPFDAYGVMVSNDVLRDQANLWRPGALEDGFGSSATLGVPIDGELAGGITLFAIEVGAFDAAELDMLSDLIDAVAFQIARLRECGRATGVNATGADGSE
ncbi:MAG TPA: GAF domain-containing protein [Coriobacteriia bacterium]|nr:GAF domain-containing protein [Coriobacteriia bacterium]